MKIKLNLLRLKDIRGFSHTGRVTEQTKICDRMKGVYVDVERGWFVAVSDTIVAIRKNVVRYDTAIKSPVEGFVLTKQVLAQLAKQKLIKKDMEVDIERADSGFVRLVFNGVFEVLAPGKYGFVNWEALLPAPNSDSIEVFSKEMLCIIKEAKESANNYKTLKELGLQDKKDWDSRRARENLKLSFILCFKKTKVSLIPAYSINENIQDWGLEKDIGLNNIGISVDYAATIASFVGEDATVSTNEHKCFVFSSHDTNKIALIAPMK